MENLNISRTQSFNTNTGLPSLESGAESNKKMIKRRPAALKLKSLSMPLALNKNPVASTSPWTHMEKIGFGTYSEVKRAVNKLTQEEAAIKICKGSTSLELLKNEAEILKQVNSDFIPKFYDLQLDTFSKRGYLIMEHIKGDSLDQYVQKNGTLREEDARSVMSKLISAVNELHCKGIAHRDIKPQNIIITEDKNVKLIDFNISKKTKNNKSKSQESQDKFKCTFYSQISSPAYAAPEVLSRECYSESVDIWGLGVALAEMLFKVSDMLKSRNSRNFSTIISQLKSSVNVSDQTLSQIKAMLSEKPDERPSISELIEQFSQ